MGTLRMTWADGSWAEWDAADERLDGPDYDIRVALGQPVRSCHVGIERDPRPGLVISRDTLESEMWGGRPMTDEEVTRLSKCIGHSSIPDAIGTIVGSFDGD